MKRDMLIDHYTEMVSMREMGMTNVEIAKALGCNSTYVYKLLGKQGFRKKKEAPIKASEIGSVGIAFIKTQQQSNEASEAENTIKNNEGGSIMCKKCKNIGLINGKCAFCIHNIYLSDFFEEK